MTMRAGDGVRPEVVLYGFSPHPLPLSHGERGVRVRFGRDFPPLAFGRGGRGGEGFFSLSGEEGKNSASLVSASFAT